jgi:hypothetical protein
MSIAEIEKAIEKLPFEQEMQVYEWLTERIEMLEARRASGNVFSMFDEEEAKACKNPSDPKSGQ